jgi:hypothetical protein
MAKKIEVIEISKKYLLKKDNIRISVTKDLSGNISIYKYNFFNESEFVFKNSKKDLIKSIGELLIEASKL